MDTPNYLSEEDREWMDSIIQDMIAFEKEEEEENKINDENDEP